jgi:hypothetical protein
MDYCNLQLQEGKLMRLAHLRLRPGLVLGYTGMLLMAAGQS